MNINDVTDLLARQHDRDACTRECFNALTQNLLRPMTSGEDFGAHLLAKEALTIFRIREWTTRRAGIGTLGFEESLKNIAALPPDTNLALCHFDGADKVYTLFIDQALADVVGCIRVTRRDQ